MKIHIIANNIEMTDSLNSYVMKKVSGLYTFLNHRDGSVISYVELGKSTNHHHKGDIFYTEITTHTAGKEHHVKIEGSDMYKTIDKGVHSLERELVSHYGRKQSMWKRGAQKIKKLLQRGEK